MTRQLVRSMVLASSVCTAMVAHAADCDIPALEDALESEPASVEAKLALAIAYNDCGRHADATILFDTVLHFEDMPDDLKSRAEFQADAARHYLENVDDQGGVLVGMDSIEVGLGGYDVMSSRGTGGSEPTVVEYFAVLSGALNYLLPSGNSLNASLTYEWRGYDAPDTHDDSDLNLRLGYSRSLDEGSINVALRGRRWYLGGGDYRHDYGISGGWNRALDARNEFSLGSFLRRREYPSGDLSERSRSIADLTAGWVHSFNDGAASASLRLLTGYNFNTDRPEGESWFYGATIGLDWVFGDNLGADASFRWENNRFNTDQIHYHPDSLDEAYILRRKDNLYEVEAGLTWQVARRLTLLPRILYVYDHSNQADFKYESLEYWVTVRFSFSAD